MYSTLAYFLSKFLMELPHNLIFPFIQANLAFFLMGLQMQVVVCVCVCVSGVCMDMYTCTYTYTFTCTHRHRCIHFVRT